MLVRMLVDMSGSRDGVVWPRRGGTVDLPVDEGVDLVSRKLAVAVEAQKPVESASVEVPVEKASFVGKPQTADAATPPKLAATPPSRPSASKPAAPKAVK